MVFEGVPANSGYPPKLRKLHLFLRNCKVVKKYELPNYTIYYLICGKEEMIIECNKENICVESLRVKLG